MATPAPPVRARSLSCPNCGGVIELRGFEHSRSAVCVQCCTIIDPSTPELKILQKFDEKLRVRPLIPLGTRGTWRGAVFEAIGFQVRCIRADGVEYCWHEYLLFNPYKGFRYLTQYDGHWNDVQTVRGMPTFTRVRGHKGVDFGGATYKHFQNAEAMTKFVMGEFPWAVRVGEKNMVDDYVSPPCAMSAEMADGEINWSQGAYVAGGEIWQAFKLNGAPPPAQGVYSNQPSPYTGKPSQAWRTSLLLLCGWAALMFFFVVAASSNEVFSASHNFSPAPGEQSFVTPVFTLESGSKNVEVELKTDLDNNWAYFNLALINESTGQGYDFGREVSYYHGVDSDGSWSEGSRSDSATIPRVPGGRYYLRIEPEMETPASGFSQLPRGFNYSVSVKRDVPSTWLFWLILPFLIIPPIITSIRSAAFEGKRWMESDYSSAGGDDDE
jgi:hypothetical protein